MKIILIIQALIIAFGVWYFYQLSTDKTVEDLPVDITTETPLPVQSTSSPATSTTEEFSESTSTVPTDIEMEWPIVDEGVSLR